MTYQNGISVREVEVISALARALPRILQWGKDQGSTSKLQSPIIQQILGILGSESLEDTVLWYRHQRRLFAGLVVYEYQAMFPPNMAPESRLNNLRMDLAGFLTDAPLYEEYLKKFMNTAYQERPKNEPQV